MHRELVTHAFTAGRPTDWASVLSIMPQAQAEAQKLGMVEFRISRLVRTTSFAEPLKQHAGRDVFDWQGNDVAVLIEGTVVKE